MRKRLLAVFLTPMLIFAEKPSPTPPQERPSFLPRNNGHPYLDLEFIYWSAKQEGNNYASTGIASTVPGTLDPNTEITPPEITSTGEVYNLKSKFKPGFRATLGINGECDAWELFVNYTYLRGSENSSVSSDDINTGILPLFAYTPNNSILNSTTFFSASGATGFVSTAAASWRFFYNSANLEFAKWIPLFSHFAVHPHFGVQGSWQKQHFKASYNVSSFTNNSEALGSNEAYFTQKFWGAGPRVGVDGLWNCCNHFGFFGNSAFALLWGKFHGHAYSYDTNIAEGYADVLIADSVYRPTTLSPVIELRFGISFDWLFSNQYLLVLHAAWEAQAWLFQNQHSTPIPNSTLLFQGGTAGIKISF